MDLPTWLLTAVIGPQAPHGFDLCPGCPGRLRRHRLQDLAAHVTLLVVCGVCEHGSTRANLSLEIATPSAAAGVEHGSSARGSPRIVLVYVVLGVTLGVHIVGAKALVADGRLHAQTTDIHLIAGVVTGAIRAADGATLSWAL